MRRRAAFGLAALLAAAVLSGCSSRQRPEGVVERWLLALNEGKAGRPEHYARDALSQRIVPAWRTKDPGQLDTIEVGRAGSCGTFIGGLGGPCYLVPFHVVRLDGTVVTGTASVGPSASSIFRIGPARNDLLVPSEGGPPIGSSSLSLWLISLGVAVALTLISMGLMYLVGKRPRPLPTTTRRLQGDANDPTT